jgi:hypothetical protein
MADARVGYAKVKTYNIVIQFPYSFTDLRNENPNTEYDDRFDLPQWYAQTQDAIINNCKIVEVFEVIPLPENYNQFTQNAIKMILPVLLDNQWILGWDIVPKTEQEILDYQKYLDQQKLDQ